MNTLLSFGLHHLWKRIAVKMLELKTGDRVLDVCGGTGDLALLAASRPTAVNLSWAIKRMAHRMDTLGEQDPVPALLDEALAIHAEDREANRAMGKLGAALIGGRTDVITHCNAGALATGGYGTALGVIAPGCRARV